MFTSVLPKLRQTSSSFFPCDVEQLQNPFVPEYPFLFMQHERPFFAFEDDGVFHISTHNNISERNDGFFLWLNWH